MAENKDGYWRICYCGCNRIIGCGREIGIQVEKIKEGSFKAAFFIL